MTLTRARQGSATTTAGDPAERAREIALRILTGAPRSSAELRDRLVDRGVAPGIANHVVDRYQEVGLLNDRELAATIARTRHREKGQARRAIALELFRRGFAGDDVENALGQITDEDENNAAYAVARKRWRRLADQPREVRERRVVGLLGRKGYAPSKAFGVVKLLEAADNVEGE